MESLDVGYDDKRFPNAVEEDFHCSICLNVLKKPMQCQRNEHHFCKPCITRHLQNCETCPSCREELTVDTLRKPSRFLSKSLSSLRICCEFTDRGCTQVLLLDDLDPHTTECSFSPVECSNEGCNIVMNKRDVPEHEVEVCDFKKVKCDQCNAMKKDIDEMKSSLEELQELMSSVVFGLSDLTRYVKASNGNSPSVEPAVVPNDIMIAGGRSELRHSTVERFSWPQKCWVALPTMNKQRSGATSVAYKKQIIVTGGRDESNEDHNSSEAINLGHQQPKWLDFPIRLPGKLRAHKTVVYKDRLLVIGGLDGNTASNCIHEILLVPPYSSKLVCRMPQPICFHGVELFDDKVFIFGGSVTIANGTSTNAVLMYDIKNGDCKKMLSLPSPLRCMATAVWGESVIVIGGIDKNGFESNKVIMYNVRARRFEMMPPMKYKRQACTAVKTCNGIVVMGGYVEHRYLDSVEFFNFHHFAWEELPSMNEQRAFAASSLIPDQ